MKEDLLDPQKSDEIDKEVKLKIIDMYRVFGDSLELEGVTQTAGRRLTLTGGNDGDEEQEEDPILVKKTVQAKSTGLGTIGTSEEFLKFALTI